MEQEKLQIAAEITPNPNTLKFIINRTFLPSGSRNFPDRDHVKNSPLAENLFKLECVSSVLIGTDFVTVGKTYETEWEAAGPQVVESLRGFFETGQEAVTGEAEEAQAPEAHVRTDIERQIIAILDAEIRPAVARDGGDIVFYGYDNGVVKLHLQGSCSTCPSSIMTLKMGIENRLKQVLPEIKEVIQV